MIMGRLPFHGHTHEEILENIEEFDNYGVQNFTRKIIVGEEEKLPPPTSKQVRDLILKMLRTNPKERISIFDIFEHEWMQMEDEEIEQSIEESKVSMAQEEEIEQIKMSQLKIEQD